MRLRMRTFFVHWMENIKTINRYLNSTLTIRGTIHFTDYSCSEKIWEYKSSKRFGYSPFGTGDDNGIEPVNGSTIGLARFYFWAKTVVKFHMEKEIRAAHFRKLYADTHDRLLLLAVELFAWIVYAFVQYWAGEELVFRPMDRFKRVAKSFRSIKVPSSAKCVGSEIWHGATWGNIGLFCRKSRIGGWGFTGRVPYYTGTEQICWIINAIFWVSSRQLYLRSLSTKMFPKGYFQIKNAACFCPFHSKFFHFVFRNCFCNTYTFV